MTVAELIEVLVALDDPDAAVLLEVGGDGALHVGPISDVVTNSGRNGVLITSEPS